MPDLDWYRKHMLPEGAEIPEGVTVSEDGRSEQSCKVCGEWVDANGWPFDAEYCANHYFGTAPPMRSWREDF